MNSNSKLRVPVSTEDHTQGSKDAPLTLVEYGDYECPFCGRAYSVIKRLQEVFKDDLLLIFRNFPLAIAHPNSMNAARAAEAAGLQQKFWEMHDLLFEHQDNLEPDDLLEYASTLNLDLEKFTQDMTLPEIEEKIAQDLYGGARSGVNGTPTFFINGFRFDGEWSYPSLLTALTAARRAMTEQRMKVIRIHRFGNANELKMEESLRPKPAHEQVLVKIHAAGVNPVDWKLRRGYFKENVRFPIPMGEDFAGEVIELGTDVDSFQVGDRVYGFAHGSYAEYSAIRVSLLPDFRIPWTMKPLPLCQHLA